MISENMKKQQQRNKDGTDTKISGLYIVD